MDSPLHSTLFYYQHILKFVLCKKNFYIGYYFEQTLFEVWVFLRVRMNKGFDEKTAWSTQIE